MHQLRHIALRIKHSFIVFCEVWLSFGQTSLLFVPYPEGVEIWPLYILYSIPDASSSKIVNKSSFYYFCYGRHGFIIM